MRTATPYGESPNLRRPRAIRAIAGLAAGMLVVSPVTAAAPGVHLIAVCTGEGTRLMIASAVPSAPERKDDKGAGVCAHATCPREIRADRRNGRSRTGGAR